MRPVSDPAMGPVMQAALRLIRPERLVDRAASAGSHLWGLWAPVSVMLMGRRRLLPVAEKERSRGAVQSVVTRGGRRIPARWLVLRSQVLIPGLALPALDL